MGRSASASSRTGWTTPVTLLAWFKTHSAVFGVVACRRASGESSPRLSGSATMAVLALLLYELLNEFAMSDAFVFYKVYGSLTVEIFCVRYVPLLVIALVCILLAFTTNGHAGRAAD